MSTIATVLQNMELVDSIDSLGDNRFDLDLLFAGWTWTVEVAYADSGVLFVRHCIQDERLISLEAASEILNAYYNTRWVDSR